MNRKIYAAPSAELIYLVPQEEIMTESWKDSKDSWKTDGFFWRQDNIDIPAVGGSVSTKWYDFKTDEL